MSGKIKNYKITLVGDLGVGKSSLLFRYLGYSLDHLSRKSRLSYQQFHQKDLEIPGTNEVAQFFFWDIISPRKLPQMMIRTYFNATSGVMLIFDTTRRETFDNITFWQGEIKKHVNNVVPGILIGNKRDLVDQRVVSTKEGQEYADKIRYAYIETSVKTYHNVTEAFNFMIRELLFH